MRSTKTLKNRINGKTLFKGNYTSIKECLEHAIEKNLDLSGVDLSYENLCGLNCDGAIMRCSSFQGANLTGANLSEAILDNSDFTNTSLYNTCLCETSMKGCTFYGASFGGTDIAGALLDGSSFSTLSAFTLNFMDANSCSSCYFHHIDGQLTRFDIPPVIIYGAMNTPVIFFENCVKIGTSMVPLKTILKMGHRIFQDILEHRVT